MKTLLWKVDRNEPTPCPDAGVRDQYTGAFSSMGCLVNHFRTVTESMSKTFDTNGEAELFMKNAPKNCYDWQETKSII